MVREDRADSCSICAIADYRSRVVGAQPLVSATQWSTTLSQIALVPNDRFWRKAGINFGCSGDAFWSGFTIAAPASEAPDHARAGRQTWGILSHEE